MCIFHDFIVRLGIRGTQIASLPHNCRWILSLIPPTNTGAEFSHATPDGGLGAETHRALACARRLQSSWSFGLSARRLCPSPVRIRTLSFSRRAWRCGSSGGGGAEEEAKATAMGCELHGAPAKRWLYNCYEAKGTSVLGRAKLPSRWTSCEQRQSDSLNA